MTHREAARKIAWQLYEIIKTMSYEDCANAVLSRAIASRGIKGVDEEVSNEAERQIEEIEGQLSKESVFRAILGMPAEKKPEADEWSTG